MEFGSGKAWNGIYSNPDCLVSLDFFLKIGNLGLMLLKLSILCTFYVSVLKAS